MYVTFVIFVSRRPLGKRKTMRHGLFAFCQKRCMEYSAFELPSPGNAQKRDKTNQNQKKMSGAAANARRFRDFFPHGAPGEVSMKCSAWGLNSRDSRVGSCLGEVLG
jgi:hypothetical protein